MWVTAFRNTSWVKYFLLFQLTNHNFCRRRGGHAEEGCSELRKKTQDPISPPRPRGRPCRQSASGWLQKRQLVASVEPAASLRSCQRERHAAWLCIVGHAQGRNSGASLELGARQIKHTCIHTLGYDAEKESAEGQRTCTLSRKQNLVRTSSSSSAKAASTSV